MYLDEAVMLTSGDTLTLAKSERMHLGVETLSKRQTINRIHKHMSKGYISRYDQAVMWLLTCEVEPNDHDINTFLREMNEAISTDLSALDAHAAFAALPTILQQYLDKLNNPSG